MLIHYQNNRKLVFNTKLVSNFNDNKSCPCHIQSWTMYTKSFVSKAKCMKARFKYTSLLCSNSVCMSVVFALVVLLKQTKNREFLCSNILYRNPFKFPSRYIRIYLNNLSLCVSANKISSTCHVSYPFGLDNHLVLLTT